MPAGNRGVWILTVTILLIGALLFFVLGGGERTRRNALSDLTVGANADVVAGMIDVQPTECAVESLSHLRESFGAGWSPASLDVALETLARMTEERRVYPIGRDPADCAGGSRQTEVGVDSVGNIVWWVSVLGSSVVQLPETVTPAGVDTLDVNVSP